MDEHSKLKMEKLSPIPLVAPTALSGTCLPPAWPTTPKSSHLPRGDAYAIECTSSPEVDHLGLPEPKQRTRSLPASRVRNIVSKKRRATPLLGLVSRKSVSKVKDEGEVPFCERLPAIEEDPAVGVTPVITPEIETVHSPQKTTSLNNFRHSGHFPQKLKPGPSNYTPLTGIKTKKLSHSDRSFNDSACLLIESDKEEGDGIDDAPAGFDAEVSMIESFESPIKSPEKLSTKLLQVEDFQPFHLRSSLSSDMASKNTLVCEGKKSNLRMRGSDSNKRKRTLDFTSPSFAVTRTDDNSSSIIEPEPDPKKEPDLLSTVHTLYDKSESDNESVVEGTPKQNPRFNVTRTKNVGLEGFATCSSLLIEADSPVKADINAITYEPFNIEIGDELSNDALDSKTNDLKLIVLSHDSSDSEVEPGAIEEQSNILAPEILEVTKKNIQSDETPTKATKAFSEAIRIEACESPDSDISHEADSHSDDNEGEKINVSTTQEEFVDESEQVRPNKRRKKGSLVERASAVIARVEASSSLFDYEMKAGLRQNKGKFVSSPLVVCKRWDGDDESFTLICKPLREFRDDCEGPGQLVALMVLKVSNIAIGSVVSVHFPITIVYNSNLFMPYVFAGNQIVPNLTEPPIVNDDRLNVEEVIRKARSNLTSYSSFNPVALLKVFPSHTIQLLSEAALCQSLISEIVLILKVRHVVRICHVSSPLKVAVLCCDDDSQCCWIEFTSERDMKRATALEALHILTDGSQIQVQGFQVVTWTSIDKKTRNLTNYCANETLKHDTVLNLSPRVKNWIISSSGRPRDVRKVRTTIHDILTQNVRGKRYLIDVLSVELDELSVKVKDSSDQVHYISGENSYLIQFDQSTVPFSLDAVYYYDGKIFSDEFTKIIPRTLLVS